MSMRSDMGFEEAISAMFTLLPARELSTRYHEPWRHYHVWSHPTSMKNELIQAERDGETVHDGGAALAFVLWHDAIYDPQATHGRNETLSAILCEHQLRGIGHDVSVTRACTAILSTITHVVPPVADCPDGALLLDVDLSILGSTPDVFDEYDAGIRLEYEHVPLADYRSARGRILSGFLARPQIYTTDWAHERWDAVARENLKRAIAALRD